MPLKEPGRYAEENSRASCAYSGDKKNDAAVAVAVAVAVALSSPGDAVHNLLAMRFEAHFPVKLMLRRRRCLLWAFEDDVGVAVADHVVLS